MFYKVETLLLLLCPKQTVSTLTPNMEWKTDTGGKHRISTVVNGVDESVGITQLADCCLLNMQNPGTK